jgi:hypothetical protein
VIAHHETLTDHQTSVPVSIPLHTALRTQNQWRTWSIALCGLSLRIASDEAMTTRTFAARVTGIDSAGDDPRIPRLVFGIRENASLHPIRPLRIAAMAILALLWFQVAQMLKN